MEAMLCLAKMGFKRLFSLNLLVFDVCAKDL